MIINFIPHDYGFENSGAKQLSYMDQTPSRTKSFLQHAKSMLEMQKLIVVILVRMFKLHFSNLLCDMIFIVQQ